MGTLGGIRKRCAAEGRVLWAEPPFALSDTTLFGGVKTGFVCDLQLLQQSLLSAETSSEGRTAEFLSRLPGKRRTSSNRPTDAARETARKQLVGDPRSRQHVLAIPQQFSILLPLGSGPLRVSAMLCIRLPDALDSFCCFRSGTQSFVKSPGGFPFFNRPRRLSWGDGFGIATDPYPLQSSVRSPLLQLPVHPYE